MDCLGFIPKASKSLIRQGFFVDRSGKAYLRNDFPLTHVVGIACGTLVIVFRNEFAAQLGHGCGQVYGRDRALSNAFRFVWNGTGSLSVSCMLPCLGSVIQEVGTISGLPFEIACLEDPDARLSAIEGYARASL